MKTVYETCDQITQVCSTNGGHETLCLTQDGKVLMLSNNWDKDDCQGNLLKGIDNKTIRRQGFRWLHTFFTYDCMLSMQ